MDVMEGLRQILVACGFGGDLQAAILLTLLITARLVAAISIAPFIGGQAVPAQVRYGVAISFALLLVPQFIGTVSLSKVSSLLAVALLIKESILGFILGFLAQAVFYAVEMAGALIDNQRGMNQISLYTPQLPGPASLLGLFQLQAAIALFVTLNGHTYFLRVLAESFLYVPPVELPRLVGGGLGLAMELSKITGSLLSVALRLSAPVLVTLFLVDVGFAVLNRVVSQVPIHSENQTVKALVSLWAILLAIPLLSNEISRYPFDLIRYSADVLSVFRR